MCESPDCAGEGRKRPRSTCSGDSEANCPERGEEEIKSRNGRPQTGEDRKVSMLTDHEQRVLTYSVIHARGEPIAENDSAFDRVLHWAVDVRVQAMVLDLVLKGLVDIDWPDGEDWPVLQAAPIDQRVLDALEQESLEDGDQA